MQRYLSRAVLVGLVVSSLSCGKGSNGPTTPSPSAVASRANLTLTISNAAGSKTATGYAYTFQTRWQETAGVPATISSVAMSFMQGATLVGTVNRTTDVPSSQVAANAGSSVGWTINDDIAGHPYATSLQIVLTFADTVGALTTTAAATFPALPAGASTYSVCGTVRDGGSVVSDIQISIVGTALLATTDQQGHYCFNGVSAGTITLQIVRSGYNTLQQSVNVTGNTTVDLALTRPSAPAVSIDSFSADSSVITKGQSTTLRWTVSNSTSVSIDNGIGSVSASGTRSVSPSATLTTYRLTASGASGSASRSLSVVAADPNKMTCTVPTPANVTAICKDGTYSMSQNNSGTCSSHNGVQCWVCPGPLCTQ